MSIMFLCLRLLHQNNTNLFCANDSLWCYIKRRHNIADVSQGEKLDVFQNKPRTLSISYFVSYVTSHLDLSHGAYFGTHLSVPLEMGFEDQRWPHCDVI